jgi:hypothetical protein
MIATRRTAGRGGDAGAVCLITASANVSEDVIIPVPIAAFYNEWDLVLHTTPPPYQTFHRAPSAGYVVGPRWHNGIGLKQQRMDHEGEIDRSGGGRNDMCSEGGGTSSVC